MLDDWNNPKYALQRERVENADLTYPPLVWFDSDPGSGGYKVVKGMPRLTRAVRDKHQQVMVKELKDHHFLSMPKLLRVKAKFVDADAKEDSESDESEGEGDSESEGEKEKN